MQLFSSIFTNTASTLTLVQLFSAFGTSLLLGIVVAAIYKYRSQYTKEFVITLSLMPTLIAVIIFLVNGSLGTSVAVAGTFSLVRFRSAAGSSKELLAIFLAMALGLASGMGYIGIAVLVTIIYAVAIVTFEHTGFAQVNQHRRHLLITVPKEFDYDNFFERNFGKSCKAEQLISVHYKKKKEALVLEYQIDLDGKITDKQIVDTVLAAGPLDVVLNKQVPKKKFL